MDNPSTAARSALVRTLPRPILGPINKALNTFRRWVSSHPDATVYAIYVLMGAVWFRGLIFDPGFLGLRDDWSIAPTSWQNVQKATNHLAAWMTDYFGFSKAERDTSLYMVFGSGFAAQFLGADGWLISRLPIALVTAAAIFAYQAAKSFGMRRRAAFAVGVAYASTPFIFDAYVTGYIEMLVGIAVLPKGLASAHLTFERSSGVRNFFKGLVWIGLSAATVHLAILVAAMIAGYCAYRVVLTPGRLARKLRTVSYIAAMGCGILFFHSAAGIVAYQLLFISGGGDQLAARADTSKLTWILTAAPRFSEAIGLVGEPYNYSVGREPRLGSNTLTSLYQVGRSAIAGLGMLAIVVTSGRERRLAAFLLAAFLFFTLAGTGFNEPFSALREQIHDIPGIALFRNSRYFSIPAALMLSLMVGLVVNARFTDVRHLNRVLGVTAAAILAVGATGFWSGNLLGNLPPYEIDRDTINAMEAIRAEPDDYRMLHLPMTGPSSYTSESGTQSPPGNNPFVVQPPKRGFWVSPGPDSFPQFFTTVFHALLGHARYPVHNLLNLGRVEYVVFDPHWQSRYAEFIRSDGRPWLAGLERPERLSQTIDRQPGLTPDHDLSDGQVAVMRVSGVPGPKFGIAETVIAGSPSLRHLATGWQFFEADRRVTHLHDLSRNPDSAERAITEIWLDGDIADLAFSYLGPPYSVEPADQVGPNSSRAGIDWVATYINAAWYLNHAVPDATGSVITDANLSRYDISLRSNGRGDELWIRHFTSPYGGDLRIALDGRDLATIQTRSALRHGYRWTKVPVSEMKAGEHLVSIENASANLNAVSRVVLAPADVIREAERRAAAAFGRLPVRVVLSDLELTDGSRVFDVPVDGEFHLDAAVPPDSQVEVSVDGKVLDVLETPINASYKRLAATVRLERGEHEVQLKFLGDRESPAVELYGPAGPGALGNCETASCESIHRIVTTGSGDGRSVTVAGRVRAGRNGATVLAGQLEPRVTYHERSRGPSAEFQDVRLTVPLDAGSDRAFFEVKPSGRPPHGAAFELDEVTESQLPHSISLVVWKGKAVENATSGVDQVGHGGPAAFSAGYNGPPRKALVRLDEKFDPRWRLTIDGIQADETDHVVLDGHFNGWFVDMQANSEFRASFALEPFYGWLQVANVVILLASVVIGWWPARLLPGARV